MGQGPHEFRMLGRIVEVRSTEQSVWHHLTSTLFHTSIYNTPNKIYLYIFIFPYNCTSIT